MYKALYQLLFIISVMITSHALFICSDVWAQPEIEKLVVTPDETTIHLGTVTEIELFVQLKNPGESSLKFDWKLDPIGLGRLEGDMSSSTIFYIIPEGLSRREDQAKITIRVEDRQGQPAIKSITLTLIDPSYLSPPKPTPTPVRIPKPVSTPTPIQIPGSPPVLTPTPSPSRIRLRQLLDGEESRTEKERKKTRVHELLHPGTQTITVTPTQTITATPTRSAQDNSTEEDEE